VFANVLSNAIFCEIPSFSVFKELTDCLCSLLDTLYVTSPKVEIGGSASPFFWIAAKIEIAVGVNQKT